MKKRVAILGFGLEGRALLSYLKKDKRLEISILDQKKDKNYLKNLSRYDLIFRSPGVPYNLPELKPVRRKLSSLTKLFFDKASGTIVGITGSAGKTTAATLLYKILKNSGRPVYLAGNIGKNPLAILPKLQKNSIVVFELSSFQLQDLKRSPKIAIILDIYEEHLDKHKSFKEYLEAKRNITRFQKKSDAVLYAEDNKFSNRLAKLSPGKKIPFSLPAGEKVQYKNIMAAALAARLFGVRENIIQKTIDSFRGLPHRLEFVREFAGVKFYNNSKATNVGSAMAGIEALDGKKVVLAGGYNKNLNLRPLVRRLAKPDVRRAIFFGAARKELRKIAESLGFSRFSLAPKLSRAVELAARYARWGEAVILSPAAASFDEFKNYEERGRRFKELVRRLK